MKFTVTMAIKKEFVDDQKALAHLRYDSTHKLARDIVDHLLKDKDCVIKEDEDEPYTHYTYSLEVFTPSEMKSFVRYIHNCIMRNEPIGYF